MTNFQKAFLAILAVTAVLILIILGGVTLFFLAPSYRQAGLTAATATPMPVPVAVVTVTASPTTAAVITSTETTQPTPTGTRVVVVTVLPSPTPTRANCINNISNFGGSGLLTDGEVQDYIRQTLPPDHLDYCRAIKFVDTVARVHATPISGNFVPVYREIFVYAFASELYGPEDLMDTIIHEIGHNVHYNMRRDNFDLDVRWDGLYKQSHTTFSNNGLGFISNYARSNKFEDFAESYMAYVRFPDRLKATNLEKYEFMRVEVFYGKEFTP